MEKLQKTKDERKKNTSIFLMNTTTMIKPNLKGDYLNICILIFLYSIQSLTFGLYFAIQILIQSRNNASYQDQALFSLAVWPFASKILWAPIIDSLYFRKIGRRKSWLIPVQYIIGVVFVIMAMDFDNLLPKTGKINIVPLTCMFIIIYFLVASQDIVVDGWSLTMLKKNNVSYASTCSTTGMSLGMISGFTLPLLLTSEDFCNKYLRKIPSTGGIITITSFLCGCGIIFFISTTLIALFKREKNHNLEECDDVPINTAKAYLHLWNTLKLPSVQLLLIIVITLDIPFGAMENASSLKLIDAGVPKDDIVVIKTASRLILIFIPLFLAKYTTGPKPLSLCLKTLCMRTIWNFPISMLIYFSPKMLSIIDGQVNLPQFYYVMLVLILLIQELLGCATLVSLVAFFSKICDPRYGGTCMTLFTTFLNLGRSITSTAALGLVDLFTFEKCSLDSKNNCSKPDLQKTCKTIGGHCGITIDGYYIVSILCVIFGIIWFFVFRNIIKNLQTRDSTHWSVKVKRSSAENTESLTRT